MTSDRRPLYRPFSEPTADVPVRGDDRARLLAVERAPLQEPPAPAVAPPAGAGGRRPLSPGGLSFTDTDTGSDSES